MFKLYTVGEMTQIFNGHSAHVSSDTPVSNFKIDSRKIQNGDWFICIEGENTDGHCYIQQAIDLGAAGIIANAEKIPADLGSTQFAKIMVDSPNRALMAWATDVRNHFQGKVLGVTGSNGKTSTKDILAGLCRFLSKDTHATQGNFNNFIGTPLTLLDAENENGWWVIEMGTNHFGEIAELSRIAQPTACIITNIGESHLEFLKNTEGVANEKAGIFAGMSPGSQAVIPENILHKEILISHVQNAHITLHEYSSNLPVDFSPENETASFTLFGEKFITRLESPLSIQNLIGALTLLHAEGVDVPALQEATRNLTISTNGRFQKRDMQGWSIIDDTYNANPTSFIAGLKNLEGMFPENRRIVVCGAMAELGEDVVLLHQKVGACMWDTGISKVFALGDIENVQYFQGWKNAGGSSKDHLYFEKMEDLISSMEKELRQGDVVLVKGSRSTRMERFIQAFAERETPLILN